MIWRHKVVSSASAGEPWTPVKMSSTDTLLFKIVMPVLLVTGVYTNTMNIIIIYRLRRLFNAFVFYFIGESASDMSLVVFVMVPRWFESLVHLRLEFPIEGQWLCKINICLLYVSVTVSAWIQAAMSLQRMSGVIWPHLVRSTRVVKMAQISVFSIVVLVMILHFGVLFGDTFNMSNCYLGSANAPANSVAGKIQSLITSQNIWVTIGRNGTTLISIFYLTMR